MKVIEICDWFMDEERKKNMPAVINNEQLQSTRRSPNEFDENPAN